MPDWTLEAYFPLSQRGAVASTLKAHGLSGVAEPWESDDRLLCLRAQVPSDQALVAIKAIAHAAQTTDPKISKIWLLPSEA
jgi:2-keto-3-deoxy-L-rhamnonate aldolase RhmA